MVDGAFWYFWNLDQTEFSECCIGILKIFPERLKPNKPHHSQVQETSLLMTKSLRVGGLVLKPRVSPKNIEVGANDSHLQSRVQLAQSCEN